MIRVKLEKRKLKPTPIIKQREQVELPLETMGRGRHFKVPAHIAYVVRNRIAGLKRKNSNKEFITRQTEDKLYVRVWRVQ